MNCPHCSHHYKYGWKQFLHASSGAPRCPDCKQRYFLHVHPYKEMACILTTIFGALFCVFLALAEEEMAYLLAALAIQMAGAFAHNYMLVNSPPRKKRRNAKRALFILGCLIGSFSLILFIANRDAPSIDGLWRNNSTGGCLCDSYNFFAFEDGHIAAYRSGHESDLQAGSYTARPDGGFDVVFFAEEGEDRHWVIQPHRWHWIYPNDDADYDIPTRLRIFHRPGLGFKARNVITQIQNRKEHLSPPE